MLGGGVAAESASKTHEYRQRAAARELESAAGSREEYLRSLGLRAAVIRSDRARLPRISELTQKSNQFNLTTRRYTQSELAATMDDPCADVFSVDVEDRFGSAGLTGVVVVRYLPEIAEIEAFLMSCRVIGRGVEWAIWPAIIAECRRHGVATIRAAYLPSAKNAMVADYYQQLGLDPLPAEGEPCWFQASLDSWRPPEAPWIECQYHPAKAKFQHAG
jgi:FkbH-like protein